MSSMMLGTVLTTDQLSTSDLQDLFATTDSSAVQADVRLNFVKATMKDKHVQEI